MRSFFILLVSVFSAAGVSAGETPWTDHQGMLSTRIVAASADKSSGQGNLFAWEAKLAPGWKTYWRSPGEAGLPVRVFVEGDEVAPLYPLPERFELFGLQTFGYGKQLLLPFYVPADAKAPTEIAVDFMVCKDICVPFEQTYQIETGVAGAPDSLHDIRFDAWLSKVPLAEGTTVDGLNILSAKVVGPAGRQKLIVDIEAASSLSKADLLAEVSDKFQFGRPKVHLLEDGSRARLVLSAMTNSDKEDLRGQQLRLTLTNGRGDAIDRTFKLDK